MSTGPISFTRYLSAKKSVDDRALNLRVWQALASSLPASTHHAPLRLLEVGAGIGTMIERAVEWGLLGYAEVTAIDSQAENIALAHQRLEKFGSSRGMQVHRLSDGLTLSAEGRLLHVALRTSDLFDFIRQEGTSRRFDLLIASAFLDLVDLDAALPGLFGLLRLGGNFYFPINFDGLTLLEPGVDPILDEQVIHLYHRTMDERQVSGKPSGDSRTGRRLFAALSSAGAEILAAGASDWVVHPTRHSYPADEAYFLRFIIHTIQQALAGHPELDPQRFAAWIAARFAQVARGELVFIAHQIDFAGVLTGDSL